MHLHYRNTDGSDGIQQGDGRVRITTGIEHYTHGTALLGAVKGIDQFALMVALIVGDGSIGIKTSQIFEISIERTGAVDFRFSLAQRRQIGTIDNVYKLHNDCLSLGGRAIKNGLWHKLSFRRVHRSAHNLYKGIDI